MNLIRLFLIVGLSLCGVISDAKTSKDGMVFFNKFMNMSNSYNEELLQMYSSDAKIIREVVKPSGETVSVVLPTKKYLKELKMGQKTAKLRKYRNKYRNIVSVETPDGVKISAERQPSNESYWLKMYQVVEDTDSGMKIKEEMMQTKVQAFLKYKGKN